MHRFCFLLQYNSPKSFYVLTVLGQCWKVFVKCWGGCWKLFGRLLDVFREVYGRLLDWKTLKYQVFTLYKTCLSLNDSNSSVFFGGVGGVVSFLLLFAADPPEKTRKPCKKTI